MMIIKLMGKEVNLDPELLKFDEHTINKFLQNFASYYNVYQQHHADAQYVHSKYEDRYDFLYSDKFKANRENSSSDKLAEMKTKCDVEVQEALDAARIAKRTVNSIWGYLRSMDRAHEDAREFCWLLRKEMDKLFSSPRVDI